MIQGGSSTPKKPEGHVDFKSAFYFQTPLWMAEAPMFLKNTIKVTDKYIKKAERNNPLTAPTGTISDMSNVPYENMVYNRINEPGRQWIRRYTLALAKEMLGYIRGKYSALPIPNAEITLNSADLISAAQTEKEGLITELKEILDTMSRQAQLERKAAEATSMQEQFNKIPLKIYIG